MAAELPDPGTLRAALWAGPLPDPAAPAAALARALEAGTDYPEAQAALRALVRHGLPPEPALAMALARWPWSIDLALVALQAAPPADGAALAQLAARVMAENRRHASLGRALAEAGQAARAVAHLQGIDRSAETWAADTACLAELLWHLDRPEEAAGHLAAARPHLPEAEAQRLALLGAWITGGAPGLAAAQDAAALPDASGLWSFVMGLWLAERDLPRARAALERLARLRPEGDPETLFDRARLALDAEDPQTARALLDSLPATPPADWPERRHVLHLRALIDLGDAAPDPAPLHAAALTHAEAAARVWPGNPVLQGLALAAAERAGDWDALVARAQAGLADPRRAASCLGQLARLGLPDPDHALPPTGPEAAAEQARIRAMLALEAGRPALALNLAAHRPASPQARARLAEPVAEAHLWARCPGPALTALEGALALKPGHMGMVLQYARAQFFAGGFAAAEAALARFRRLKTAQTGHPPQPDLRDLITADALASGADLPESEPAAESRARLGPLLPQHPGLAACWLARPGALPAFRPGSGAPIPPHAALYWEGPVPAPVARGLTRWRVCLPDWTVTLFDAAAARAWLEAHDPEGAAAFDHLADPAARADLFRACWLAQSGGLFVDSDEYPRAPLADRFAGASCVIVLESGYGTAANNFLAAAPGLALIAAFRARILRRLAQTPAPYAWWDSGPAQLTATLAGALVKTPEGPDGLRILSQAEYCARVTTNLPFPHKRRPDHWRQRGAGNGILPPSPEHGQITP